MADKPTTNTATIYDKHGNVIESQVFPKMDNPHSVMEVETALDKLLKAMRAQQEDNK